MSAQSRLPKRLVWAALLFLFTGASTASAGIEDFAGQVASPPIGEGMAAPSVGAVVSLIITAALGIFYFWAGFGLLRRQERWRRRAVYLSRVLIGLLGLCFTIFLFGEISSFELEGLWTADQSAGTPPLPPPVIRLLALLLLGIVTGIYVQALRVLQSDSIRREFLGENKEAISTN
mgnify:FL=1